MRKIILIYCTFSSVTVDYLFRVNKGYIPRLAIDDRFYPPLGLLYLAAALKKGNFEVELLDISFLKGGIEMASCRVGKAEPLAVGVYVSSVNLQLIKILISRIKELSPRTKIVVGGPHVHHEPDCVRYLNADFGVVSDGELAMLRLAEALEGDLPVDDIANIARVRAGKLLLNRAEMIEDLDSIPFPARELWPYEIFSPLLSQKAATLVSSRGCRFDCSFCASIHKGSYRGRSVGNIIEELKLLQRQGFRHVEFMDDNMTLDAQRVKSLCEEMARERIRLKWACMSRIDCVDKDLLKLMKRANCTHIKYGIESGSQRVRKALMGKNIDDGQIMRALRDTKSSGISTFGFFVLGMPGESYAESEETLRFARELDLDYAEFRYASLFCGSAMFREAVEQKKVSSGVWEDIANGKREAYEALDSFVRPEVKELRALAMRRHYLNLRFLVKEIFTRTDSLQGLLKKFKILFCRKYNAYLTYKSFYCRSTLAYSFNYFRSWLENFFSGFSGIPRRK